MMTYHVIQPDGAEALRINGVTGETDPTGYSMRGNAMMAADAIPGARIEERTSATATDETRYAGQIIQREGWTAEDLTPATTGPVDRSYCGRWDADDEDDGFMTTAQEAGRRVAVTAPTAWAWVPADEDGNPTAEYSAVADEQAAQAALDRFPFGGFIRRTTGGRDEYSWGADWHQSEAAAVGAAS